MLHSDPVMSIYRLLSRFKIPVIVLFYLLLQACSGKQPAGVSFYYWKTVYAPAANEQAILQHAKVQRLYVRYFDIRYDAALKRAIPVSPVHFDARPAPAEVVPVIYLKNNVLEALSVPLLDSLALQTLALVRQINTATGLSMRELQIDCDWTHSTAKAYFRYLLALKAAIGDTAISLSATIRLHQVKYPDKTGIPPVDKGVLMYYNMGKIGNSPESSIYDRDIALRYIASCNTYPLALDFALPVFSWGVQLRQGKVLTLLNKTDSRFVSSDSRFIRVSAKRFRAVASFFKDGFYFRTGDEVKTEEVTGTELLEMAKDLSHFYHKPVTRIIFYDLDSLNISRYDQDVFQEVTHHFY